MNKVTVGIPAYKRREPLQHVLGDLVRQGLHLQPGLDILVIDDDSQDGTYEAALAFHGQGSIRVLRNEQRAGFRGNFGKLIEHCRTEYLLYSCDDDFVLRDGVVKLLAYLETEAAPPALISSLFHDKGAVYRANPDTIEEIRLDEYRNCCAHLPGVVINARLARAVWPRVEPYLLDARNAYPQCCLALVFQLFDYRCIYYPVELVKTGYDLETGITAYSSVAERWKQFLFFSELLEYLCKNINSAPVQAKAGLLLEAHKRSLFRTLGNGVMNEHPELAPYYLAGAAEHFRQP